MVRWLGVACLMMMAAPALAQQRCDTSAAVATMRQRQDALLRIPQGEIETGPEIPAEAKAQIPALKDALAVVVDAWMRCAPAAADAKRIESGLRALLPSPEPSRLLKTTANTGDYGGELSVAVSTPSSAPQMRVVELQFGILCGTDTVLLIYEPAAAGWRQVLRWQAGGYDVISGAFGDFFDYVLLPGKGAGAWQIAVAHGMPLCTSRWSEYKVDLLTTGASAEIPRVVWHAEQGYVRESHPRMAARPDGFELRADVGTIESDQMVRKGVFRYRVDDDTVERVAPIAVDGRGFVDAWLQAPWSEAKGWSAADGLAGFEQAHEAFANARRSSSVTYSYGPVRACTVKGRYEVEMDADPGGPQFYAIHERSAGDGYTMVNYGTTQDERCSGPDLMKKR